MNLDINMRNVATAVIILSTLGAVLDMALTVTTSVYEISIHKPEMKLTELVESGMQIGREVIGTTVNTLLFAYLGESLLLFSYLKMQDYTLETLLNSKILFQNCVSMIFGAIACVVVMPVAAVLVGKRINIVLLLLVFRIISKRQQIFCFDFFWLPVINTDIDVPTFT